MDTLHPTHRPVDLDPTTARTLRDAAIYLRRHGWTQGQLFTALNVPTPAACAIGAVRIVVCGAADGIYIDDQAAQVGAALRAFASYLDDAYYAWGHNDAGELACPDDVVGDWNDDDDRTADQVITALDDAADFWDRRHPGGAR